MKNATIEDCVHCAKIFGSKLAEELSVPGRKDLINALFKQRCLCGIGVGGAPRERMVNGSRLSDVLFSDIPASLLIKYSISLSLFFSSLPVRRRFA